GHLDRTFFTEQANTAVNRQYKDEGTLHPIALARSQKVADFLGKIMRQNIKIQASSNEGGRETGSRRGGAADKHARDAQRAPVHSSSCGAQLRLCEAICDLCRLSARAKARLAFAGANARRYHIVGGGVSARPAFLAFAPP
ncbi:MAG: hypothetical protein WCF64_07370, partial [Methylocella sp.]